jgi:hypothetical protein
MDDFSTLFTRHPSAGIQVKNTLDFQLFFSPYSDENQG